MADYRLMRNAYFARSSRAGDRWRATRKRPSSWLLKRLFVAARRSLARTRDQPQIRWLVVAHAKLELVSVRAAQYDAFHRLDQIHVPKFHEVSPKRMSTEFSRRQKIGSLQGQPDFIL
ncbi:hypothetical protein F4827_002284 [Paraburkholderia bannensis]|uniref:Uncharacterized protein n=1 Tax=Paraburkholderia bannensis TaxID=765414 RepID=A0A7W9WQT4_9BURK|nr:MULTISPECIES: hypothetical protein [Paraburkholderia]MBB3257169.1 hypothetical protein [Paraburkholderia sp. WP4_3_2]MBB6102435.1 hypothetical protein [Paraburkholderia bannensis]